MTNNPTFAPGDVAWHVRHGMVTLEAQKWATQARLEFYPVYVSKLFQDFTHDGRECRTDVGRVLYTLDEARQYGWLKEPRTVMEFEEVVTPDLWIHMARLVPELRGKRVKVTVEEIPE